MILGCATAMACGCSSGVFEVRVETLRGQIVPSFFDGTADVVEAGRETWLVAESSHVVAEVKIKVGDNVQPGTELVVFRPRDTGVVAKKSAAVRRLEKQIGVLEKAIVRNQAKNASLTSRRLALSESVTEKGPKPPKAAKLRQKRLASLDLQIAGLAKSVDRMQKKLAALCEQKAAFEPSPVAADIAHDLAVGAPLQSLVADVAVEAGQRVSQGDRLVLLKDDRIFTLSFVLDAGAMSMSQPVQVALNETRMLSGTVSAIEPMAPKQRVRVVVHIPSGQPVPTAAARFRLVRRLEAPVYQVPGTAIGSSAGAPCVFVVAENRVRAVGVSIVKRESDMATVQDPSGTLFDGQSFVAALVNGGKERNVMDLSDKNPVRPVAATAPATK
jgi:biotin carboxyl carrier protein